MHDDESAIPCDYDSLFLCTLSCEVPMHASCSMQPRASRRFYALSRARCLCTTLTSWVKSPDGFYALSRARCLCTTGETTGSASLVFLCTLSCEVPMHNTVNFYVKDPAGGFYALSRARCLCTDQHRGAGSQW